jgi:hypothetical protein
MFIANLLYPKLLAHASDHCRTPVEKYFLRDLRAAPVYELSSVISAFEKRTHDDDQPIPKRPPHDVVWAEYKWDEGRDGAVTQKWTVGNLLVTVPIEEAQAATRGMRPVKGFAPLSDETRDLIASAHHSYVIQRFYQCDWTEPGSDVPAGRILCQLFKLLAFANSDFTRLHHVAAVPHVPLSRQTLPCFGLQVTHAVYPESNPIVSPWPMETCFALMGCKNVVCDTVTPTPKQMRSARRHRERPPSAYRVLRLTKIVKTAAVCADGEDGLTDEDMTTEERAGVRFHLRRGHYKNLQSPRYKHPGWYYWPACWCGDESLGKIPPITRVLP